MSPSRRVMHGSHRTRWLLALAATMVLVAAGCGSSASVQPPLYSATAARAAAEALIASIPLPPSTQRIAQPPPSVARELRAQGTLYAREQVQTRFWLSTQRPEKLLAFIKGHMPERTRDNGSGYGGTAGRTESWFERLEAPSATALAGPRQVLVSISLAPGGRYAARLEVIVAWHLRRPTDSLVPSSAGWVKATVTKRTSLFKPSTRRTLRTVVTTDPAAVRKVAEAVNSLPLAAPAGPYPSCPAMGPQPVMHLTFRAAASSPDLATVQAATDACVRGGEATAWVHRPGYPVVELSDTFAPEGMSFVERVEAALDHRLHLR